MVGQNGARNRRVEIPSALAVAFFRRVPSSRTMVRNSQPFLDIEKRRFLQWASFHLLKGFPFMREDIVVIGGGLAGSEAAWQAANHGAKVTLYEMRPKEMTKAHKTGDLAELVCSNSLGSADPLNAPGILKAEMRRLNSLVIRAAEEARVPAGSALAVDREQFARAITQRAWKDIQTSGSFAKK